ncbi:MAG: DUF3489 domain-containing protein [Sphingobium sp.]
MFKKTHKPVVANDAIPTDAKGSEAASAPTSRTSPTAPTKRSLVVDLLRRDDGATLPELCVATGWQAHSVRAVLTGLRKRGYVLEKSIRDSATCYQISGASDAER